MINKLVNKIKFLLKKKNSNSKILAYTQELDWANVYHDSIRGKKPIEELGLNIGRWAGNYSFFYVLNRILSDYKPSSILELGLGESTKFISTHVTNYLPNTKHVVVEQSEEWYSIFNTRFELGNATEVICCPIEVKQVNGFDVNFYKNFNKKITEKFDLYVIDGPFGTPRFSRYDIVSLVNEFESNSDFIILFDDTNRRGERDTLEVVINTLKSKKIKNYVGYYKGIKHATVVCSEKYKFAISL